MTQRLRTVLAASAGAAPCGFDAAGPDAPPDLPDYQSAIIEPLITQAGGHILMVFGDAFLAEFVSVENAVSFAASLQQAFGARTASGAGESRASFRIGLDLWDSAVGQREAYDACVKVAVGLQIIAEPGDILISEPVYQHVHRCLPPGFAVAGKHRMNQTAGPVTTYRVLSSTSASLQQDRHDHLHASIAVLPFVNMGGDPEQDCFSDGLADDIIAKLSTISGLFVASRDAAFRLKGAAEAYSRMALTLGVQYLLLGSVKKYSDRFLVNVELFDGHTQAKMWTRNYSCGFFETASLQGRISADIIAALHLKVLPKERAALDRRSTSSSEAYRFYLMGRSYINLGHRKSTLRLARQMFQRAIDIDPDYAAAHAGIADCCAHLIEAGDFSVTTAEIFDHSQRALTADATLAAAHASRGLAFHTIGQYADAEESFERAMALQPDLFEAHYFYGRNCFNLGQLLKAAELFGQAAVLNTDDFRSLGIQSMCFHSLSQPSDARTSAWSSLARVEAAIARRPDNVDALSFGAGLLAYLGEYDRTRAWAERASILEPDDFYTQYNVACAYAVLGDKDEALDRLERIMMPPAPRSQHEFMMQDSDLDTLRDHPRYILLLKRLGYRD